MARKVNISFLRDTKDVKEQILPVLMGAGLRGAGVIAGVYANQYVVKVLPASMSKFSGLLLFAAGTLGEAYINEEMVAKACQGLAAGGLMRAALDISTTQGLMAKAGLVATTTDKTTGNTTATVNGKTMVFDPTGKQLSGLGQYEYQLQSVNGPSDQDFANLLTYIDKQMKGIPDPAQYAVTDPLMGMF